MQQQQQQAATDTSGEPETFAKWLKDSGLTEESVTILQTHGFTSKVALKCAQPEDVEAMQVQPLAQRRIMETIICSARGPPEKPQGTGMTASASQLPQSSFPHCPVPGSDVGDQLATLFANMGTGSAPPRMQESAAGESTLPFLISPGRIKHLDIVDFVTGTVKQPESVLLDNDGTQIVLKSNTQKLKLDSVQPVQWTSASIAIMFELLRLGQLKATDITSYLLYMKKVCDLATRYTWISTLYYDRAFRQYQAQVQCDWRADNIHLTNLYLKARHLQDSSAFIYTDDMATVAKSKNVADIGLPLDLANLEE